MSELRRMPIRSAERLYKAAQIVEDLDSARDWYMELSRNVSWICDTPNEELEVLLSRTYWLVPRPRIRLSVDVNQLGNLEVRWRPYNQTIFGIDGEEAEFDDRMLGLHVTKQNELLKLRNPWVYTREDDTNYRAAKILMLAVEEYWGWMIGLLEENLEVTCESRLSIEPTVEGRFFHAHSVCRDANGNSA